MIKTLYKMKKIFYKTKDIFHIGDYWRTIAIISILQKESDNTNKLEILYKFIIQMWKKSYPNNSNSENRPARNNWEKLYEDLSYYSDRWCFERIYHIMETYNVLNNNAPWFCKPNRF